MIIFNSLTVLLYVLLSTIHQTRPNPPTWAMAILGAAGIANIVFAVALLKWKKWGFFGLLGTAVLIFAINLRNGVKPPFAILGAFGVVCLYAVLQVGGKKKGWSQLE